jgi:hypothetical protein
LFSNAISGNNGSKGPGVGKVNSHGASGSQSNFETTIFPAKSTSHKIKYFEVGAIIKKFAYLSRSSKTAPPILI